MTAFQWLTLSFLGLLLIWEALLFWRGASRPAFRLLRCVVWLAAAGAIAWPNAVQSLATAIGITRGADLVFYLFVLAFLMASFYFYARSVRLERQLTQVVRHLAISQARRGTENQSPS